MKDEPTISAAPLPDVGTQQPLEGLSRPDQHGRTGDPPVEIASKAPTEKDMIAPMELTRAGTRVESTLERHNVIVFGETGAGKSSIINMIVGHDVAASSSTAAGCTFHSEPYETSIDGLLLKLWDTSGLNEGRNGTVSAKDAVNSLFDLITRVQGVSLLVYCIRGPRIKSTTADNYELFYNGLCHGKVPILLVVTGLEGEEDRDSWWNENQQVFRAQGLSFAGQAGVVATRGKVRGEKRMYDEEYEESASKVRDLIKAEYSKIPWKIEVNGRLGAAMNFMCRMLDIPPIKFGHIVGQVARSRGALSEDTEEMVDAIKGQSPTADPKVMPIWTSKNSKPVLVDIPDVKNVIIFGQTGAGKSSVINLVAGETIAEVDSRALGCTFQCQAYELEIDDAKIRLWDTVGLNEGVTGKVPAKDAIIALYKLLDGLADGVSLLVYCVRAPRITEMTVKNYEMFYKGFCKEKIPIVLLVTGLEMEEPFMASWWPKNGHAFERQDMHFRDQGCITATKGKYKNGIWTYGQEYEDSQVVARQLIKKYSFGQPWKLPKAQMVTWFFKRTFNLFAGVFGVSPYVLCQVLYEVLKDHGGMSSEEAMKVANEVEQTRKKEEEAGGDSKTEKEDNS
ncbi:hypothetical protein HWV62_10132 [Athelia sp. TMB]|nr:hypothetical protein HWV62_10132 [Athelia sp. TMB]